MLEVIAHRRKMRNLLVQRISNKPPICHIHADFFQCTAQRTNAVNVLNKYDSEQHNRVYAGTPIIFAVQILNEFIHLIKVDCCIDLPQQMIDPWRPSVPSSQTQLGFCFQYFS